MDNRMDIITKAEISEGFCKGRLIAIASGNLTMEKIHLP